jgi:peptidoglycan-associated lipoprotein
VNRAIMEHTMRRFAALQSAVYLIMLMALVAAGCGKKEQPVVRPQPPGTTAAAAGSGATRPPEPPTPVDEPIVVPPEPAVTSGSVASIDEFNRNSPLKPVFFELDSAELNAAAQAALNENAALLKKNASWALTIEGHTDERGTAEYNLALGERRAIAARTYLVSLGISADRLRTVSYGKEFPFDAGKDEAAYSKNRRAHFVLTAVQ